MRLLCYDQTAHATNVVFPDANSICMLQTKALLRIAEEEEQDEPAKLSSSNPRFAHDDAQQRWDCESVLSMRSNLDNHPGSICEPSARKYRPQSGKIKLAAKTGQYATCCYNVSASGFLSLLHPV